MSPLELSLAAAALLIGLTGTWSPCGFSMVETIGIAGDLGRRRTVTAACAAFAPGAVVGGVVTFGALSALGDVIHGAGGRTAYLAAAAIAVAAAAAEARGVRIAPQIRRQLPEGWRWTMPLPLAAGLYGVLLGLGFTTFVLSFGVWALAGISLALGDPAAGLLIGAAFGVGRALPVVAIAPLVDRPFGRACVRLMAERPALYRLFRLGDAATLGVVAAVLVTGTAAADRMEAANGSDPSAAGKALAFQKGNRSGVIRFEGQVHALPGRDPALGGPFAAVISGHQIQILDRTTLQPVGKTTAYHAQSVAISRAWLAYLTLHNGRYLLKARRIEHARNPGPAKQIAAASAPSTIGHPSLNKGRAFFTVSKPRGNAIKRVKLASGEHRTLLRSRAGQLLNPSALGKHLLYVRVFRGSQGPLATSKRPLRQFLMMRQVGGHGRGKRIYKHDADRGLWTTSMDATRAYVTLLGKDGPKIVSVGR